MLGPLRLSYVYVHRRASDGQIFYVGKGRDRRAWSRQGRNRHWHIVARKHGFTAEIVVSGLPEASALMVEQTVIAVVGFGRLTNATLGGGGVPGWRHSAETRRRISEAGKGREFTERQRAALAVYNAEKKLTEEHKAKLSAAKKGKTRPPHSLETRAKIAASHIGIRPKAETLKKMSDAKIGKAVGRKSPSYDHTVRTWRNDDGREFSGTRGDLIKAFSLGDPCVSAVISGRRESVKGWRLK